MGTFPDRTAASNRDAANRREIFYCAHFIGQHTVSQECDRALRQVLGTLAVVMTVQDFHGVG